MDLAFGSAGLATLCNVESRMADRWGPALGRTVAKRLLDLAAATVETIERIPTATLTRDQSGAMTITFDGTIAITGRLTTRATGTPTDPDRFVISHIEVDEDACA